MPTTTDLLTFSRQQVAEVRRVAAQMRRMLALVPTFDAEAYADGLRARHPMFRGVSTREVLREVLLPGTFTNGGDA